MIVASQKKNKRKKKTLKKTKVEKERRLKERQKSKEKQNKPTRANNQLTNKRVTPWPLIAFILFPTDSNWDYNHEHHS